MPSASRLKSGDTPEQHFPAAAKKEGLDAIVSVDLLLNERGEVLEAQVIRESPSGLGFGLAALDTAKTFVYENPLKKLALDVHRHHLPAMKRSLLFRALLALLPLLLAAGRLRPMPTRTCSPPRARAMCRRWPARWNTAPKWMPSPNKACRR